MADMERSKILDAFLYFAIIANIAMVVVGIVILFITSDTYGVYASSVSSACALFNVIGLTLIMRWHKNGLALVFIASLLSAIALSITCAGWLTYSFGIVGVYIPYGIMALYIGILLTLIFQKVNGKTIWQQMDINLDLAHFRHIYQLTAFIFIFIFVSAYFVMPKSTEQGMKDDDKIKIFIANVSIERLDSPDVTIEEIISFEKTYNEKNKTKDLAPRIKNRIFALKHLLLSGLMSDVHNRDYLINIFKIHSGSFSEQQQAVIDWFLALDSSQQSEWNRCSKVYTLSEFKEVIQNKMQ